MRSFLIGIGLFSMLGFSGNQKAEQHEAILSCATVVKKDEKVPTFILKAKVAREYKKGSPLQSIQKVSVTVGDSEEPRNLGTLAVDSKYRSVKVQNRVRIHTPELDASELNGDFDGVVHGILLPKVLSEGEITERREDGGDGTLGFLAQVIASRKNFEMACDVK